jgi:hypothetical protein
MGEGPGTVPSTANHPGGRIIGGVLYPAGGDGGDDGGLNLQDAGRSVSLQTGAGNLEEARDPWPFSLARLAHRTEGQERTQALRLHRSRAGAAGRRLVNQARPCRHCSASARRITPIGSLAAGWGPKVDGMIRRWRRRNRRDLIARAIEARPWPNSPLANDWCRSGPELHCAHLAGRIKTNVGRTAARDNCLRGGFRAVHGGSVSCEVPMDAAVANDRPDTHTAALDLDLADRLCWDGRDNR